MHTSTGILRIERSIACEGCIWAYLECCAELGRYYRFAARFLDPQFIRLMKPAWGTHVTVIRREVPKNETKMWGRNKSVVTFQYEAPVRSNNKHVWLDVDCEEILDFRESVGLPRNPEFKLHCTVGVMPGEDKGQKSRPFP